MAQGVKGEGPDLANGGNGGPRPVEAIGSADPSASGLRSADAGDAMVAVEPIDMPPYPPGSPLDTHGNYKVVRMLGRGAMGAVYLVEHTQLGKRFAAKVVAAEHSRSEKAVARLRNEAKAASAIEHENIVNVTDLGATPDGAVFVVMELLRGQDLRARLVERAAEHRRDPKIPVYLPDEEIYAIVQQILRGLSAAHVAGIIHRDLKPENVFLAEHSGKTRAKIVDFGISKLQEGAGQAGLTGTGQIVGTPLYMAPEQAATGEIDGRVDLYSLGAMVYEMATGQLPFPAKSVYEVLVKHATVPPVPPSTIRPDIPPMLEKLVLRCLEKDPRARFASAAEMLEAWNAAFSEAAVAATIPSIPALERHSGERTPPVTKPTSSVGLVVAAVVLGAAIVVGGFVLSKANPEEPIDGEPAVAQNAIAPRHVAAVPPPVAEQAPPNSPDVATPPPVVAQTVHVPVTSTPSGADVLVAGELVGHTPMELEIPVGGSIEVVVRHHGTSRELTVPAASDGEHVRLAPTRPGRSDAPSLAPR